MSLAQARLLIGVRRWAEAKAALADELADPDAGGEPWFLLAQIQLGLGDPRAARVAAGRGLGLSPDVEWGHRLLSIAELGSGNKRAAQRAAEHAVRLRPDQPHSLYALTEVLLARGRTRPAQRLAEHNLAANPLSALARESAAAVALRRRRWPEAERQAREGLRIDPQDGDLMMQLGVALQAQGKRVEAAETYAAAARSNPTDQRGRRALGKLGMSVAGGGFVALKLLPAVAVTLHHEAWLTAPGHHHALLAAGVVAVVLGLRYGIQEVRQRRAVAQISPQLRSIARQERRSVSRGWLRSCALSSSVLAVFALVERDYPTAALLAAVDGVAICLRHRWSPRIAGSGHRVWQDRLPQSIRWRFR